MSLLNKIPRRLKPKMPKKIPKKMSKKLYLYLFKNPRNLFLAEQRGNKNCKKKSLFRKRKSQTLPL